MNQFQAFMKPIYWRILSISCFSSNPESVKGRGLNESLLLQRAFPNHRIHENRVYRYCVIPSTIFLPLFQKKEIKEETGKSSDGCAAKGTGRARVRFMELFRTSQMGLLLYSPTFMNRDGS